MEPLISPVSSHKKPKIIQSISAFPSHRLFTPEGRENQSRTSIRNALNLDRYLFLKWSPTARMNVFSHHRLTFDYRPKPLYPAHLSHEWSHETLTSINGCVFDHKWMRFAQPVATNGCTTSVYGCLWTGMVAGAGGGDRTRVASLEGWFCPTSIYGCCKSLRLNELPFRYPFMDIISRDLAVYLTSLLTDSLSKCPTLKPS